MYLQACADEAFDAIKTNTGREYPHATIAEAFEAFTEIGNQDGIVWLIQAASGTGIPGSDNAESWLKVVM